MRVHDYCFNYSFYGIIVSLGISCDSVSDYGSAYPNPQPILKSSAASYYIAGGWNNTSLIPDEFAVGDERSLIATRTSEEETYENPPLQHDSRYCFLVFVHLKYDVFNVSYRQIT